jgi:hypothetical protein
MSQLVNGATLLRFPPLVATADIGVADALNQWILLGIQFACALDGSSLGVAHIARPLRASSPDRIITLRAPFDKQSILIAHVFAILSKQYNHHGPAHAAGALDVVSERFGCNALLFSPSFFRRSFTF